MGVGGNIWKLQVDRFFGNCWVYIAILVPFFESHGLSASQIFLTEAVFAAVMVVMELPTGYISDVIGRRICYIIGSTLIPVAVSVYFFSSGFWGFALAEGILAVGLSFRSGTDTSILYDSLLELGREGEHKAIEGTAHFLRSLGSAFGNLLGSFLSSISLLLPFVANIITSLVLLPLALFMKEPARESRQSQNTRAHINDLGKSLHIAATKPALRNVILYMILINGIGMVFYWSNYINYTRLGFPVYIFGIMAALSSLSAAMGSKLLHRFDRRFGEKMALFLPLMMGPFMVAVGFVPDRWMIPFIFLAMFCWGFALPLLQNILHKNTTSNRRATLFSLANMGGRLLFVILSLGFGHCVDQTNVQSSIMGLGVAFFVITMIPCLALRKSPNSSEAKS